MYTWTFAFYTAGLMYCTAYSTVYTSASFIKIPHLVWKGYNHKQHSSDSKRCDTQKYDSIQIQGLSKDFSRLCEPMYCINYLPTFVVNLPLIQLLTSCVMSKTTRLNRVSIPEFLLNKIWQWVKVSEYCTCCKWLPRIQNVIAEPFGVNP